jgi:hypothetical protein
MRFTLRNMLVVSLLVAPLASHAQAVDPSGHWEGAITLPNGELTFQVDVLKKANGDLVAAYSRPENNLTGLPLTRVTLDGRAISFVLTGNTTFQGVFFADGKTISGDVTAPIGTAPFSMTRTGDAVFAPIPKNAPIARELEGIWNGTLSLQGESLRLVLKMANQADGTAVGTIISVDRGDLELPLGMTQKASMLTLHSSAIGGDFFAGALNGAGELAGTFSQGPVTAPLTFVRAPATGGKE